MLSESEIVVFAALVREHLEYYGKHVDEQSRAPMETSHRGRRGPRDETAARIPPLARSAKTATFPHLDRECESAARADQAAVPPKNQSFPETVLQKIRTNCAAIAITTACRV